MARYNPNNSPKKVEYLRWAGEKRLEKNASGLEILPFFALLQLHGRNPKRQKPKLFLRQNVDALR